MGPEVSLFVDLCSKAVGLISAAAMIFAWLNGYGEQILRDTCEEAWAYRAFRLL